MAATVLTVAAAFAGSLLGASGSWAVVVGAFVVMVAVLVGAFAWSVVR